MSKRRDEAYRNGLNNSPTALADVNDGMNLLFSFWNNTIGSLFNGRLAVDPNNPIVQAITQNIFGLWLNDIFNRIWFGKNLRNIRVKAYSAPILDNNGVNLPQNTATYNLQISVRVYTQYQGVNDPNRVGNPLRRLWYRIMYGY